MPNPMYWFEKINEAIDKPKGDRASIIVNHGDYINDLLNHYKDRLSENSFSRAETLAEELREYVTQNYERKFKTVGYARNLVSDLKSVLGYDPIRD